VPRAVAAGSARVATAPALARPSSGDQIARWIRAGIVDGRLGRGDRVTQDEVARELGVSRIPVREALVALDREGWVTIEPHRGAFVHGVDAGWVHDHYEILGALYGLAASRAAARGTDDERHEIERLHRGLKAERDVDRFDTANHTLLQYVLQVARAPRIVTAMRAVTSIVPGNFFAEVPGAVPAQRRGLAPVVRAIVAQDPDRSRDAMEALLDVQGSAVVRLLRARGVLAEPEVRA
jgi:DNA-binding GntR family transcriptional regulator